DRDWNSGDVCRARRISGGFHLHDDAGFVADEGVPGGCDAGGAVVGAAVFLGESSGEEVAEQGAGNWVCDCGRFAVDGASGAEAVRSIMVRAFPPIAARWMGHPR